jgi:hypothetical protein
MAVDRLFSVEFAKQGLTSNTPLQGWTSGGRNLGGNYPGAMADAEKERAFIKYSSSVLGHLAMTPDAAQDERVLFQQIVGQVRQPDFKEFTLALQALSNRQYIEASGQNQYGDFEYRLTDLGRSVAPPAG